MKKGIILSIFMAIGFGLSAQQAAPQWHNILGGQPESYRTQLISSSESSIQVNVQVPGFYTASVTTPRGEAQVITLPKAVSTAHAGEPDMPMTGIPVLIGDKARMSIRVVDAQYRDFEGIEVAPSKGDFPRTINPEDVPYTYGACYSEDAFFPASNIGLYEPYIIRDFRGQNMVLYPFAYNPATKTLRVYYNMTVEMYKVDDNGSNTIESRRSNVVKMDPDFKSVYQRHFINYEASMNRYTPLDEEGDLLIICYDNFISSMTDFVNWKKTRGVNTTIVGTSTAGSTYSAIKTYIQSQYNANNNITHVLLVGDVTQIPGYSYSGGGSSYSGLGDNAYGQIVGSDYYNDVFIGRFSASTAARVTTQCNRVITYERDLTTSASWLQVGQGIAKKEGGSGHNGEDDYQHMDVIRTDLLNYGYSTVYQRYANLSGYTATAAQISADINSGVGIINYCNHGAETMWGVASYSVSHVNALTNENKLPFIWSVACLVGKYDHSSDCFAEAWMNATNNSNPTGAIGTLMSYISQPWIPPMWAQDECVDILAGLSSSGGTKHTWGGVSINGLFGIFDNYGTDQSAVGTYQAWILYGDPSMLIRTKTPQAMTVTHTGSIAPGATSYAVTVNNGSGAVATITDADHNILGKATVSGTTATININGTLTAGTELTLCVYGFDKVTYLGTISVVGGTKYTIAATANPSDGGTVSGAGQYYGNTSCTLTATPAAHYDFSNWKKGSSVVSTDATYTFEVTESATYTATFTAIPQYTISVSANPTAGGTVSGGGTFYSGTSCTLTATPNTHYDFTNWKMGNSVVSTNLTYTFTVTQNASYTANFSALQAHTITCNPVENGSISANPTTAYKNETVTLSATPASGYFFSAWDVRDANNNSITVTDNQFTMPDSDVTVGATFASGCTVTVADVEHGTVTASATNAIPGATITLTATPVSGYVLNNWLVYQTGDVNTTVVVTNNQFTLPAYDVTVVGLFGSPQGGDVSVGSGTSNSSGNLPTRTANKYSLAQQIYTASELDGAGTITSVAFKVSNGKTATRSMDIYLSHTEKDIFSDQSDWIAQTTEYKVFSGSVSFSASGWTTVTFDTPFEYNGTSNLLLSVDDNSNTTTTSTNNLSFYTYSTGENRALFKYNNNSNYDPASMSGNGSVTKYNNQVIFTKTVPGGSETLITTPNTLVDFSYTEGAGPSLVKNLAVIGTNLTGDITVTAPTDFEISDTENGTYGSSLTLTASSRGNRETLTYDFEDGWQNWTTFQGTTTSPNSWMHNTEYPTTNNNFSTGYGYNSSDGFMLSESYISGSSSGSGTAVTPDNYLVSPQVTLGGSITFHAGVQNVSYCAEKFSVMVSTTGNNAVGDFTAVQTWTYTPTATSGSEWQEFTVDLSAYSGTGYIAIRHFDCYDQWILKIDDVTIVEGEEPVTPPTPTTDLLAANVYVRLKGGLGQGFYNETLSVTTGDVTSNVGLNGEVYPTLAAGWNWWTPTKAMTLEQLEDALGGNAVLINTQGDGFARYENGQWSGTLTEIAAGQMYKIEATSSVSLTMSGTPATGVSLTILPGYNWFGYTGTQAADIATALGSFAPVNGDTITDKDGHTASYNNGWSGSLTTLQPGHGYVYLRQ
ncbi:MAG: choice-of-anchor J domain-containing protein [Bacteroidales bacterium]|nr:choice-of-anchor J domain-containing protein [Bacteroidales bacterium]MBR6227557.1 choice-of-anchor J domain-containing protein [Bacteroidales bacterium]